MRNPDKMTALAKVLSGLVGEERVMLKRISVRLLAVWLGMVALAVAQSQEPAAPQAPNPVAEALRYRLVGPFRGGRSCAVAGVPGKPLLFYFGSTGGGV